MRNTRQNQAQYDIISFRQKLYYLFLKDTYLICDIHTVYYNILGKECIAYYEIYQMQQNKTSGLF